MRKLALVALAIISLHSCKKSSTENNNPNTNVTVTDINQLTVPPGFNYKTSDLVQINISLLTNDDKPIKGVRIDLMNAAPEDGGKIFYTGVTNASGVLLAKVELPLYVKEVVINTDYIGLPNNVVASTAGKQISQIIGGKTPQRIRTSDVGKVFLGSALGKGTNQYSYRLGKFTTGGSGGVPNYLLPTNDVVNATFLEDVNASLPERQPVPSFRPEYLASTAERNLILKEQCDVWVTFVHEGAGYQNSLFYFVYNVNNKPTTVSQVDSFITVFPNCSYAGSGGGMATGNKVLIGRFGADTAIGFAIAANAWNGTKPGAGLGFYTTIKSMNPETDPNKKEHVVLLYDNPTQRFLIGFEDINRGSGSDEDFNDAIIYATANPVKAVETTNILPTTPSKDKDGDGVNDTYDEYPEDPDRAFNVYYPSANTMATVAFEDLWPSKGDYDLNDIVVDFRYHAVTNGKNEIKDLNAKFKLRAAGGVFRNAFYVEFPFNKDRVKMNSASSGVDFEAESNAAILKVFKNAKEIIATYNTLEGSKSYVETDTLEAKFTLNTPIGEAVGTFNPFIVVDEPGKGRGYEIHLPGKKPTELVDSKVFGTASDATNPDKGVYYKTSTGLPYAISIPEKFDYPFEKVQVIKAYAKFAEWVQSGGNSSPDWYMDLKDYRDQSSIYQKP